MTDTRDVLFCDTECYPNFWSIGFTRLRDGKVLVFEHSHRRQLDVDRVRRIMAEHTIVGYNFLGYDLPMIYKALDGADNAELKAANDRIIVGRLKYWDAPRALGVWIPDGLDIIDLIEPQPNAFASLKTLMGRLHCRRLQDLPYTPDTVLTDDEMDKVVSYMGNDIGGTGELYAALKDALDLRVALGAEYGLDFRSKSDSQIGEAIVKRVAERQTGRRVERPVVEGGRKFNYEPPAFLRYDRPELQEILDRLRATEFVVKHDGKVDLPKWLEDKQLAIGDSVYAMGIGGLHSTEANRSVTADADHKLYDVDVTGYYPQIIINSGLYPPAIGPAFCGIYADIKHERDRLKPLLKDPATPKADLPKIKVGVEGRKIVGNGVFGKTSSPYSSLYAPHLMIYTTLTGQLSILMLIDRLEAAGMSVVSANTDGVVIRCPVGFTEGLNGDRFKGGRIREIVEQWERDTGFALEAVEYEALYSLSVNTYIAVKPGGKAKRKGTLSNPYKEGMREQLMKNPNMGVVSDAVVEFLTKGTSIDQYIRSCRDIRDFVTVVNVKGGGTWRGDYLGKVVRYIWSTDGDEILYKEPHPSTGNFKKVSKSDGCRPLMDLPDEWPADLDYQRYIDEAHEILRAIGYRARVAEVKVPRVRKADARDWLLWSLAA